MQEVEADIKEKKTAEKREENAILKRMETVQFRGAHFSERKNIKLIEPIINMRCNLAAQIVENYKIRGNSA